MAPMPDSWWIGASALGGWLIEVVKHAMHRHSFEVLPCRWVVERTFGWLGRNRRLSKSLPLYLG